MMNEGPRYPAPAQPPKGHGKSLYTNPGRVPGPWVYGLSPKERQPVVPLMRVKLNTEDVNDLSKFEKEGNIIIPNWGVNGN